MFERNQIIPKFALINNQLVTNCCVWCGRKGDLTESHLFPESIGGRFSPKTTCSQCNKFLGRKFESKAKYNAFITAALVKLNLTNKREAYRHSRKYDTETNIEMHITKNGMAKAVSKNTDRGFVGTPEEQKRYIISGFRKKYPNWPTEPLEAFYDDPKRTRFTYIGVKYVKKTIPGGPSDLLIKGLVRDPSSGFIFKVVCEFLALLGFQDHHTINNMMEGLIRINKNDKDNRIVYSDHDIRKRCLSNTVNSFKKYKSLEEISFDRYHYLVFKLSNELVLYLEVVLFGQLKNMFILGRLDEPDARILPLIDEAFIFPIDDINPFQQRCLNLKEPRHPTAEDVWVDVRFWEMNKPANLT